MRPEDGGIARAYAETFYGVPQPDWAEALAAWKHVRTLTADAPDFANGHLARVSLRLGLPEQAETYLDLIHDPAFASVVDTLRRQAEAYETTGGRSLRRRREPRRMTYCRSVPRPSR